MEKSICVIVTVMYIAVTTARQYDLTFKDCYRINYCNDEKSYSLTYDGYRLGLSCNVTFHGYDESNVQNKYRLCIRASEWEIYDYNVILRYYSGKAAWIKNQRQMYSKYTTPNPTTEWCSDPDEYVDVQLTTSYSILTQGRIKLEVYVPKGLSYVNYGTTVGVIVGSVLGGLAVIAIIVTVIIIIVCRRKRQPGTVLSTYNAGGATVINQTSAGLGNMTYNLTSPPPYYPKTSSQ